MNTLMRCIRKNKRGIVGIEAAIVLIAFVVIAAALAYVVINMGFYASQTAKSTINNGINEATSALELDGYITGMTSATSNVTFLAIPVKLAVGQQQVDMGSNTVVVAVQGGNFSLANIYSGAVGSTNDDVSALMEEATAATPNATCYIYNGISSTVLSQNAKAYIIISLTSTYGLVPYAKFKVDIRTSVGASLTLQRDIPGGLPANTLVDLG
jgi:flagellin FlaB